MQTAFRMPFLKLTETRISPGWDTSFADDAVSTVLYKTKAISWIFNSTKAYHDRSVWVAKGKKGVYLNTEVQARNQFYIDWLQGDRLRLHFATHNKLEQARLSLTPNHASPSEFDYQFDAPFSTGSPKGIIVIGLESVLDLFDVRFNARGVMLLEKKQNDCVPINDLFQTSTV